MPGESVTWGRKGETPGWGTAVAHDLHQPDTTPAPRRRRPQVKIRRAVPYYKVADLEASVRWYCGSLGYVVLESVSDQGEVYWAMLGNGAHRVMLSSRPIHGYESLTWLYVDDVDAVHRELTAAGFQSLTPPTNQVHRNREFLITDPAGNVYVLAHPLPPAAAANG